MMARLFTLVLGSVGLLFSTSEISALVSQLDHQEFSKREEASARLQTYLPEHREEIERLFRGPLSVEQRLRLEAVLSSGTTFTRKDLDQLAVALRRGGTDEILACFEHFGSSMSLHGGTLLEGIPDIGQLSVGMTTHDHATVVEFRSPESVTSPFWYESTGMNAKWEAKIWMPKVQWGGRQGFAHNGSQWVLGNSWNPMLQRKPMPATGTYQISDKVFRLRGDKPGAILSNICLNAWTIPGLYSLKVSLSTDSHTVPVKKGQETVANIRTAASKGEAYVSMLKDPFHLKATMQGAKQTFKVKQINGKDVPYGLNFT
ncbi:MAG: hypothetical protein AB7F75_13290, partial [Planctomycetota bacterium]